MIRIAALLGVLCCAVVGEAWGADARGANAGRDPDAKAAAMQASATSLASVLSEDGTLEIPEGFSGSLDPSGYALVSKPGEAPRFAAKNAVDDAERWRALKAVGSAPQTWSSLGTGTANGVLGSVNAVAVAGSDVYVGGELTQAGGGAANRVARFNTTTQTWSSLGTGAANGVSGGSLVVYALAVSGSDVYVGGRFDQAGGVAANNVARFNTTTQTWSVLGSGAANGVNNNVFALAIAGSDVYVGGSFTQAGGAAANRLARFDTMTQTWSLLGSGAAKGVNGNGPVVIALAVAGSDVYVGGRFTQAGGAAANNVARFNTTTQTWSLLGSGAVNGVNSQVNALAIAGSDVYVGGAFSQAGGAAANYVARFDTTTETWSSLGSGAANGLSFVVYALAISGGDLNVGGLFGQAGGAEANNVARFVVSTQDSTTTIVSSLNPNTVNTPLTLTASVTGLNPTSSVAFRDGASIVTGCAAVSLTGTGNTRTAQCTTSALAVGTRSLTAAYLGDSVNATSTSSTLSQSIVAPALAVAPIALDPLTAAVAFSQTLSTNGAAGATPPFTFALSGGALPVGLSLNAGVVTGTPILSGPYGFTVTATDSSSAAVGGPFTAQRTYTGTVSLQATTTTIGTITPASASINQPYTVPVTVTAAASTPGGAVNVADGSGGSCSIVLSNGAGSCNLSSSTPGPKTITATYLGQGPHAASAGTTSYTVSGSGGTAPSLVSVGSASTVPGGTVTVSILFSGDGSTRTVSADLLFDRTRLNFVRAVGVSGASCARLAAPNDDRVNVSVSGATPLPTVPIRLCDVTFAVPVAAAGGNAPLTLPTATCSSISGGLECSKAPGTIGISSVETNLPIGSDISIAGRVGETDKTRILLISNRSPATTLNVSCEVTNQDVSNPALSLRSLAGFALAPGATGQVTVGCTLPPLCQVRRGVLLCRVPADPVRPRLAYGLTCTTVGADDPLPGDQIFDDLLKTGAQLGTSSASVTQANGSSLMLVGAPLGGADSNGRVLVMESLPSIGAAGAKALASGAKAARSDGATRMLGILAVPPRLAKAGNGTIGDKFGQAVAATADGSRIAVGAPSQDSGNGGRVFIYERPAGGWDGADLGALTPTVINAPAPTGNIVPDEFGAELAFAPDGDLVVGAPGTTVGVPDAGAVYVYQSTGSGFGPASAPLTSPATTGAAGRFGDALDIDSGMLVVGAPEEGPSSATRTGAAYMFPTDGTTFDRPQAIVPAATPQVGDKFGSAMGAAGGIVVVGASGRDTSAGADSGAVTVFRGSPQQVGLTELTTLLPAPGASQGAGAAVATNGDVILVGAPDADVGSIADRGRVYLYDVEQRGPAQAPLDVLENAAARPDERFGRSVAVDQAQLLGGAPLADNVNPDTGTVVIDAGRADPFVLDRISRSSFE